MVIGKINPELKDVTVVGGGFAGLVMAYSLDRKGYRVRLVESESRLGGLIRTTYAPEGIAESAAHSILATPVVKKFLDELEIEVTEVRPCSKARYILREGKMRKFPLHFSEALRAFFRLFFRFTLSFRHQEGLTLAQWGESFLGKPALDYLLSPFVRGIYAAEPCEMSVSAAFPLLLKLNLRNWRVGNFFKRKERAVMVAPQRGMSSIIEKLSADLKTRLGDRLVLGVPVHDLASMGGENLILTVPAYRAANLLEKDDPELALALSEVTYTAIISVTVFVSKKDLETQPLGVGVLMPQKENRKCLGILFNSSSFEGRVFDENRDLSLTVMLGGSTSPEIVGLRDEEIMSRVQCELDSLFHLKKSPEKYFIHRWIRGIPLYDSRLEAAWNAAQRGWCSSAGRILFGNYTGKVSLRGMIESVETIEPYRGSNHADLTVG